MNWITRERPKIDRLACPWLIRKFVDTEANFIFVPQENVIEQAKVLDAIPFDLPNVEYTHYGNKCTFDYIIEKHQIQDEAVNILANIVRGADTDRHDFAKESAGLWAISAGLAHNISDDYQLLEFGFVIYDALYSWAKYRFEEKHLKNSPFESLLHVVYTQVLNTEQASKRKPKWVKELKDIIQDQIDTQFMVNLKDISATININPSYLSREFSKHFDDLSFGDYIRKLRIEKAIKLIEDSDYSLTEIAYMTGFSDQSHFSRVFKKFSGKNPIQYKKEIQKSK